MRAALTRTCFASLLALAVFGGLSTRIDEYGNLPVGVPPALLLLFAALILAAAYFSGAMERLSTSVLTSSVLAFVAGTAYWAAALVRHPGELAALGPLLADAALTVWAIAAFGAVAGMFGGVLGACAHSLLLFGRWARDSVWAHHGVHR